MSSPEFEACRRRTHEEEIAVIEAEWRRIGWPAQQEVDRLNAAYDDEYQTFHSMCTIDSNDGCLEGDGAAK